MPTSSVNSVPFALPILPRTVPTRITPTDVSQFVRLEQCERFLRLRLSERAGQKFMEAYGVAPQRITPLMSLSGSDFRGGDRGKPWPRFRRSTTPSRRASPQPPSQQREVLDEAADLKPGEVVILFQPRLEAELDGWLSRGDVDLIKLERSADGALHVLIGDMKSTAEVKVEHRLQVAFYRLMLEDLLKDGGRVRDQAGPASCSARPPTRRPRKRKKSIRCGKPPSRVRPGRRPARSRRRPGRLPPVRPTTWCWAPTPPPAGSPPPRSRPSPTACPSNATAAFTTSSA